jgi:hypothetical protein
MGMKRPISKHFVLDKQILISKSNSEPVRNEPVIVGECAGEKMNIFLDTGAEMLLTAYNLGI